MTTALLLLLVLVELARLVLQYRSGKTYVNRMKNTYCKTTEVENIKIKTSEESLQDELNYRGLIGYEIAAVSYSGFNKSDNKHYYTLFFTKKKVKNFIDEKK